MMTSRTLFLSVLMSLMMHAAGPLSGAVFAQEHEPPFIARSTGNSVNVRAGQSANFERLCQLSRGEEVLVLAKEYSWYKVQLPVSAKSYVSKEYVQFLGLNAGGVTAKNVNVRAGPGIHHTVLGQLPKGAQIYIQEELPEWYRIEPVAETHGWILQDFLEFKHSDISDHQAMPVKLQLPSELKDEVMELGSIAEGLDLTQKSESDTEDPAEEKSQGLISVAGTVEEYEDSGADGIYYKIVADGETVCYVQGTNHMLGRFVNQQVSVDGTVNQKLLSEYPYPVIFVVKVRLLL